MLIFNTYGIFISINGALQTAHVIPKLNVRLLLDVR